MDWVRTYRMRLLRKRCELRPMADRTGAIRPGAILVLSTFRNEAVRLPWFLRYYRGLGVDHFLMVDNGSTDGGRELLAAQPDVSLWTTDASYRRSRFGVDWLNGLAMRHGVGHWCLPVDPDELLVYPFCDTRPLHALTDWLDASSVRSFGAMLLDMYPKGPLDGEAYRPSQDPLDLPHGRPSGRPVDRSHGRPGPCPGPRPRGPRRAPA